MAPGSSLPFHSTAGPPPSWRRHPHTRTSLTATPLRPAASSGGETSCRTDRPPVVVSGLESVISSSELDGQLFDAQGGAGMAGGAHGGGGPPPPAQLFRPAAADDPIDLLPLVTGLASAREQRTSRKHRTDRRRVRQVSLTLPAGTRGRGRRPPLPSASAGTRRLPRSASSCRLQVLPGTPNFDPELSWPFAPREFCMRAENHKRPIYER